MPELPEVETNARNLARWATGKKILAATAPPGTRELGGLGRAAFVRRVVGRTVEAVTRRGKWILVRLSGGDGLGLHLGMTGKISNVPGQRFTRATFSLDDGTVVGFVDSRRFGRLIAAKVEALLERPDIRRVGPDALSELDARGLAAALARTKRTVKEALLDQTLLAGVGNLYATEALWRAKIHPATPAQRVAADGVKVRRLLTGIRAALRHGLRTFERPLGKEDIPEYIEEGAPNPFHAYDRAGRPCHRCGTMLKTMVIGGRSSAFCPHCQKLGAR